MAISLDPATKLISVPQADLTLVTGSLYSLDTNQFRNDVMALLASENYIWMDDAFQHNTEVTVAGTTFARTIEFINGYSIKFEDTGGAYSVRLEGSNNNIFDVENGILTPTSLVTIISTNSAGLVRNEAQSIGQADLDNIADAVWDEALAGHTTAGTAGKSQSDTETTATSIDGKADAILIDTSEIGVAGAGLTNINLPDQTMNITGNLSGSVGSISGVTFPTNFGDLAITLTTGEVTVGTNNDKTGYSISGAITTLDGLNNISVTEVGDAVWDEPADSHLTAGTTGLRLRGIEDDTNILLADVATNTALISALNDITAGDVWDVTISAHLTAGSTGEALNSASATAPTAADIADAVWDEPIDDHLTAGSVGAWLKNKVLTVAKYLGLS
jgi:hypothetical protein